MPFVCILEYITANRQDTNDFVDATRITLQADKNVSSAALPNPKAWVHLPLRLIQVLRLDALSTGRPTAQDMNTTRTPSVLMAWLLATRSWKPNFLASTQLNNILHLTSPNIRTSPSPLNAVMPLPLYQPYVDSNLSVEKCCYLHSFLSVRSSRPAPCYEGKHQTRWLHTAYSCPGTSALRSFY